MRTELGKDAGDGRTKGQVLVEQWVKLGMEGNPQALSSIADRIDGRPAQTIELDSKQPTLVFQIIDPRLPLPGPQQDAVEGEGEGEGEVVDIQDVEAPAPTPAFSYIDHQVPDTEPES